MNKPTLNIDLERRRVLTTGPDKGRSHIKIWVTFVIRENGVKQWKQRPYKTGLFCTEDEFDIVMDERAKRVSTRIYDIRAKLTEIKAKASRIIDKLNVTDQKTFESYFLSDYAVEAVAGHFESKIAELQAAKKISSAEKYTTAIHSFQKFFGEHFTFQDCTVDQLQAYEDAYISTNRDKEGLKGKKSLTSVGFNMRCLRHIFKRANKKGITTLYPFGVGAYVIPEGGDDTKKFLETEEKNKFINWRPADEKLARLHDYARFIYYANGINPSDFARLRKTDIFKEHISIDRKKTKGRKKKSKKLIIPIHPVMREIIKRRGNKSLVPDDYVFPVLERGMDEEVIFYKIRDLVDDINEMLAVMAKELSLEIKPTSYTLRHTFSFHFMKQGGTTEELQDALAHGTITTTESYKHGFELERKKKYSEGL